MVVAKFPVVFVKSHLNMMACVRTVVAPESIIYMRVVCIET